MKRAWLWIFVAAALYVVLVGVVLHDLAPYLEQGVK